MLASTIQFTTNPPTPTQEPPQPGAPDEPGNQGALPQNPDSMPPPHTQGHPPRPISPHKQEAEARQACFLHQAPDKPTTPAPTTQAGNQSTSRPAFREEQPPAGPDPYSGPDNNDQEATPTQHQSLERR